MRDKIFITFGLASLNGVGLELFGVISESIGVLMFFFHAVNSHQINK